jgi:hypothetical protein
VKGKLWQDRVATKSTARVIRITAFFIKKNTFPKNNNSLPFQRSLASCSKRLRC